MENNKKDQTASGVAAPAQPATQAVEPVQPAAQTVKPEQPAEQPAIPDGSKPIRSELVKNGVSNDRIGWNEKNNNVTVDGNDVYKPSVNIDGTTYAPEADIQNITEKAYQQSGNPLEWSRGYVTDKLGGGAVEWDGQNVNVAGRTIKPVFVRDGHAFVDKKTLDNVISEVNTENGIKGNKKVADDYRRNSGDILNGALDQLMKRKQFSYDSDTDAAFQQLKALREAEADAEIKSALARTGSSVANASAQTLADGRTRANAILDKLAGELYDYQTAARSGYDTDTQTLRSNLSDATALFNDFYNKDYTANRDSISDRNTAQQFEHQVMQDDIENQRSALNDIASRALTDAQIRGIDAETAGQYVQNEGYDIANEGQREANRAARSNNRFNEAVQRGGFYRGDEEVLPWITGLYNIDSSGFYVDADGNRINPAAFEALYNYLTSGSSAKGSMDAQNGAFTLPKTH